MEIQFYTFPPSLVSFRFHLVLRPSSPVPYWFLFILWSLCSFENWTDYLLNICIWNTINAQRYFIELLLPLISNFSLLSSVSCLLSLSHSSKQHLGWLIISFFSFFFLYQCGFFSNNKFPFIFKIIFCLAIRSL